MGKGTKSNGFQMTNLKYFVLYGVLFEVMTNLYKPFGAKFLQRLGGTELHISLLNALPGVVMFLTVLPGTLLLNRLSQRKKGIAATILLGRVCIFLYAMVPFMPEAWQPMSFVVITAMMSLPTAIYLSGFQGFIGDVFPEEKRAKAIGQKNLFGAIAVMVVTLLSGQILANLPGSDAQRILIYQIFFVIAFVLGLIEIGIFMKMKPVTKHVPKRVTSRQAFTTVFSDEKFKLFLVCSLLFHFGWQMGWPLFSIYQIQYLGADEMWLSIIRLASFITMIAGYRIWPKLIDRWGNPMVTAICTVGMAMTPVLHILAKDLYVLTGISVITGVFTSGTVTVLLSGLLEVIPQDKRIVYMGVYNTFINLSLAVSPMVGHFMLSSNGIYFALWTTGFFRLVGGLAFCLRSYWIHKNREQQALVKAS